MSYETRMRDLPIPRAHILMVQQVDSGRVSMPIVHRDRLPGRAIRRHPHAHHPPAGIEYTAIAVPEENIVDIMERLVRSARTFFPDEIRGVQLVIERTLPESARTLEGQPEPTPQEA